MLHRKAFEPRADAAYLAAFAEIMQRLGEALASAKQKPVAIYVAGGAALHLYTGARVSKDIDAKVMARFVPPDNLDVAYRGTDGRARLLYFDTQYNDTYALLHEDAYVDSVPVDIPGVDEAVLDIRLLSPTDLAVSKLSRYEIHDQEDIRSLARAGLVDAGTLETRAREALPGYVGDTKRVENSIGLAVELVRANTPKR